MADAMMLAHHDASLIFETVLGNGSCPERLGTIQKQMVQFVRRPLHSGALPMLVRDASLDPRGTLVQIEFEFDFAIGIESLVAMGKVAGTELNS